MKYVFYLSIALLISSLSSCEKKTPTTSCDDSITYTSGIKSIIDNKCATAGCHVGNFPQGNFTTYAGLKPALSSGTFKREVITKKSMPKNSSLSESDFNKIDCWVAKGFPE